MAEIAGLHKLRRAIVRAGRERLAGVIVVDECYLSGNRFIRIHSILGFGRRLTLQLDQE
jgi:hypothetical protein